MGSWAFVSITGRTAPDVGCVFYPLIRVVCGQPTNNAFLLISYPPVKVSKA